MKINLTELGRHEALLRISAILKAGDKHIQLERKLTSELIKNWRESYEESLREIFRRIPEEISQQAVEIITQGLAASLGQSFGSSQKVRDELRKYITRAYQEGKSKFTVKSSLNLPDLRAIDILTRHNCYWIGEHYGKRIGKKIAKLTQDAITDGLGRKELAEELRAELGGKSEGYKYWDVVSSSALVRSRSFGCVAGMVEAGITEYEILAMGDERMCPICGEMHGRTFSVSETQKVIDSVLDIKSPDKFKEAMPWQTSPPTGVSSAKLLAEGMSIPPFHGRCRCVLVMAETTEHIMLPSPELERVKPTPEYQRIIDSKRRFAFEDLEHSKGMKITESDVRSAEEKIKNLLASDDIHVGIKFNPANLESILKSGRFKSQFETGKSGGMLDFTCRAELEHDQMSYSATLSPHERPVYGMLFELKDVSAVNLTDPRDGGEQYGNSVAFFRKDIKRYATFTGGDSLDDEGNVLPSPILSPSLKSVEQTSLTLGRLFEAVNGEDELRLSHCAYRGVYRDSYVEAQIHGGHATVDNIEHIVFGRDVPERDIPKEMLKEHKISWSREK